MGIRVVAIEVADDAARVVADLASVVASVPSDVAVGLVTGTDGCRGPDLALPAGWFALPVDQLGLDPAAPELVAAIAALGGAYPREVLVVARVGSPLLDAALGAGAEVATVRDPVGADLAALVAEADRRLQVEVGVGPHPEPWPEDARLDPALLAAGDRRNVVDRYRYWREDAIAAEVATRGHRYHVAVENWQHDLNIGTVVRNANAFAAAGVHIVGRRRWNRRGAMATDRYLPVTHHDTPEALAAWAEGEGLVLVGIDNGPGSVDLDQAPLPERVVLVFGQEGPGLSPAMIEVCERVCAIRQFGSTRSLNAGVASGIAMHVWITTHAVP